MNRNDLLKALSAATATAALTITAFWPAPLGAEDPQPILPQIAQPKLVANGVELSLTAADGRTFKIGEAPVFELAALNTNSIAAQVKLHIAVSSSSPADSLSRVIRTPGVLWQTDQALALGPGESKKVVLACGTKLPPLSLISVSLQETGTDPTTKAEAIKLRPTNSIIALSFSTFPGRQQPEPRRG